MPEVSPVEVTKGYKFAVLSLPESRGGPAPVPLLTFDGGYAVSQDLPERALETWEEGIGRFRRNELAKTKLFLWTFAPSKAPEVLDGENQELGSKVYRFYLGLLLATPYFSNGQMTLMTGANADGAARVRSIATYSRTYHTLGAPPPHLTVAKFRLAARLAEALQQHDASSHPERMERTIRAFRQGCEAGELDLRLHQFVRCAEGFAVPPFGKSAEHFANRLKRLCAGHCRRALKEMYLIRSGIEHLHGPFARLPKSLSRREKFRWLLKRCVQSEALAHYLLLYYLLNPSIWVHFVDVDAAKRLWSLKPAKFRREWPSRLGLDATLRDFDLDAVERHERGGL